MGGCFRQPRKTGFSRLTDSVAICQPPALVATQLGYPRLAERQKDGALALRKGHAAMRDIVRPSGRSLETPKIGETESKSLRREAETRCTAKVYALHMEIIGGREHCKKIKKKFQRSEGG